MHPVHLLEEAHLLEQLHLHQVIKGLDTPEQLLQQQNVHVSVHLYQVIKDWIHRANYFSRIQYYIPFEISNYLS